MHGRCRFKASRDGLSFWEDTERRKYTPPPSACLGLYFRCTYPPPPLEMLAAALPRLGGTVGRSCEVMRARRYIELRVDPGAQAPAVVCQCVHTTKYSAAGNFLGLSRVSPREGWNGVTRKWRTFGCKCNTSPVPLLLCAAARMSCPGRAISHRMCALISFDSILIRSSPGYWPPLCMTVFGAC